MNESREKRARKEKKKMNADSPKTNRKEKYNFQWRYTGTLETIFFHKIRRSAPRTPDN